MRGPEPEKRQEMTLPSFLSAQEVKDLAKRVESGDMEARETLITSHLPLVKYLANGYLKKGRGVTFDDLYQEGCCGLIQAVDRYDYRRGALLSSYASYYIIKHFNEVIRNNSTITLPENIFYLIQRYTAIKHRYMCNLDRPPTIQELARDLSLSEAQVRQLHLFIHDFISLDSSQSITKQQESNETGRGALHDVIPSGKVYRPVEDDALMRLGEIDLGDLKVRLTDRESAILRRHLGMTQYGKPETFKAISVDFGLSPQMIRVVYHTALRKLKLAAETHGKDHL